MHKNVYSPATKNRIETTITLNTVLSINRRNRARRSMNRFKLSQFRGWSYERNFNQISTNGRCNEIRKNEERRNHRINHSSRKQVGRPSVSKTLSKHPAAQFPKHRQTPSRHWSGQNPFLRRTDSGPCRSVQNENGSWKLISRWYGTTFWLERFTVNVRAFEDPSSRSSIRPSSKSLPGYLRLTDSLPRRVERAVATNHAGESLPFSALGNVWHFSLPWISLTYRQRQRQGTDR